MIFFTTFSQESLFDNRLLRSTIFNNSDNLDLKDVIRMLQGFGTKGLFKDALQTTSRFLKLIPIDPMPKQKLKILVTQHVLLNDVNLGEGFSVIYEGWTGFKVPQNSFTALYQIYLVRIAHNIDILLRSKRKIYFRLQNADDELTVISKLINLLNFMLGSFTILGTLNQTSNTKSLLLQEIYLLIWNDTVALFLMLENVMSQFQEDYESLTLEIIQVMKEYSTDYNQMIEKVEALRLVGTQMDRISFCQDYNWKKISKESLVKIERRIQDLRLVETTSRFKSRQASLRSIKSQAKSQSNNVSQRTYPSQTLASVLRTTSSFQQSQILSNFSNYLN